MEAKNGAIVVYIPPSGDPVLAKVYHNNSTLDGLPGKVDLLVTTPIGGESVVRDVVYSADFNTVNRWTFPTSAPLPSALRTAATAIITALNLLSGSAENTAVGTTGNGIRAALGISARTLS